MIRLRKAARSGLSLPLRTIGKSTVRASAERKAVFTSDRAAETFSA